MCLSQLHSLAHSRTKHMETGRANGADAVGGVFSLDLRTSQDQKHGNTQKQSMILVTHGDTTWQSATACYWDCCMSTRLGMRMVADSASGWIGKERSRSWGIASAGKRDSARIARMARMARIRTPMISNVLLPVVARCGTHISHMNEGTWCSILCTGRPTSPFCIPWLLHVKCIRLYPLISIIIHLSPFISIYIHLYNISIRIIWFHLCHFNPFHLLEKVAFELPRRGEELRQSLAVKGSAEAFAAAANRWTHWTLDPAAAAAAALHHHGGYVRVIRRRLSWRGLFAESP